MPGAYARKGKDGKLLHYVIWWKDENGVRRKEAGPRDKGVAEKIAREYQNRADLARAGLADPKSEKLIEHARKPIGEHVEDFIASRVQVTKDYVKIIRSHTRKLFGRSKIRTLGDLAADPIETALSAMAKEGFAAATLNRYQAIACAFSRWCWKRDRLRDDPLKSLEKRNTEVDRRRIRRTLTAEEFGRLIAATISPDKYRSRKLDGPTRALVYRLAAATGLRLNELRTLAPARLDLGERPAILLEAGNAKNRRSAWQPLPTALAVDLRAYIEGHPGGMLFAMPNNGAKMLRKDLKKAGIPYKDDQGRYFDFHSLRCELATLADAQGIPIGINQKLMRHSTPVMTAKYTRHGDDALSLAVESLPIPGQAVQARARQEAPGRARAASGDQSDGGPRSPPVKEAIGRSASTAPSDPMPGLQDVVSAWPGLSPSVRGAILALVAAGECMMG